MQNRNVKGSLAAAGTVILVTVALLGMKKPQFAPVDELDSPGAALAVNSVGGIGPMQPAWFDMGFLDNDIFNRLVSEFSIMAPARAVETGGPMADRILGPLEVVTIDESDRSTWTAAAERIADVFYQPAGGLGISAAFAMTDSGPWRIAIETVGSAAPMQFTQATARPGGPAFDDQVGGYVVIGSFAVADNALAHADRHEKWHPMVMSAKIRSRDLLLVVVGPFIKAELRQMLELVVLDGIEDAWLFTPKGDTAAG